MGFPFPDTEFSGRRLAGWFSSSVGGALGYIANCIRYRIDPRENLQRTAREMATCRR